MFRLGNFGAFYGFSILCALLVFTLLMLAYTFIYNSFTCNERTTVAINKYPQLNKIEPDDLGDSTQTWFWSSKE